MLRRAFHQTIKMPRPRRVRKARPHTKKISATVSTFLIDAYVTHSLALQPRAFAAVPYTILRISLVDRDYQWSLAYIFRLHLQLLAVSGHSPATSAPRLCLGPGVVDRLSPLVMSASPPVLLVRDHYSTASSDRFLACRAGTLRAPS